MTLKPRHAITLILAVAAFAFPAGATTLVRMSLAQLSEASSLVVRGRVASQQSRWNEQRTRIITLTTITVAETMKGDVSGTVVIEQPGGTVGNLHVRVPGTAIFRAQAQYVLFLEPSSNGRFRPVGMMQGVYRIYESGSQKRVILPLGTLALGSRSGMLSQSPSLPEFHEQISAVGSAPIVLPSGTAIPVLVVRADFLEVGHFHLAGRTTTELFPGLGVVIPAGSAMGGSAIRVGNEWKVYWTEVSIRGVQVRMSAAAAEPASEGLIGKTLLARVR